MLFRSDTISVNVVQSVQVCDLCGGLHQSVDCQVENPFTPLSMKQANYVSNFSRQQNNPYSNTYNPSWKSHHNFSWNNNQNIQKPPPPGFQQNQQQPPEKKSSLEDALTQLSMTTQQLSMTTQQFITKVEFTFQNQAASIKNLETQVGQLANMMNTRPQGALPSNTE